MSKDMKKTIIIRQRERLYKVTKILWGADGSFYVLCPYHQEKRAFLGKMVVNYDTVSEVTHGQIIDLGIADNDRLKLSFHPDGFVQFSGPGLVSGRQENGTPKGIGVVIPPLSKRPLNGPVFSICISDISKFDEHDVLKEDCSLEIVEWDEVPKIPQANAVLIDGHYFGPLMNRFVYANEGKKYINRVHPNGTMVRLRVIEIENQDVVDSGFLALEIYTFFHMLPEGGYTISGPAENVRRTESGATVGDGIFCGYPRPDWWSEDDQPRDLNYCK